MRAAQSVNSTMKAGFHPQGITAPLFIILALLCAAVPATLAQATYVGRLFTESFDGADGTLPPGWEKAGTNTAMISNNQLLLSCEGNANSWVSAGVRKNGFIQQMPEPGTLVRVKGMAPAAASSSISRTYAAISTTPARDVSYFTYGQPTIGLSRQTYATTSLVYIAAGTTNIPRDGATFATLAKLYLPEDASGNRGVISFVDNLLNAAFFTNAVNIADASTILNLSMQQGAAGGTANEWVRYDDLTVFSPKTLDFGEPFNRRPLLYENEFTALPGSEWTVLYPANGMHSVSGGALQLKTTNTTSGAYNLNLTMNHASALGRDLAVGEYIEVGLRRNTIDNVGLGVSGSPQYRNFSLANPSSIGAWRNTAQLYGGDQTAGHKALSASAFYDFNKSGGAFSKLGLRLDYADGEFQVISLYFDRVYATSWYQETAATSLTTATLHSQGANNEIGQFDYIRIWGNVPPSGTVISIN